MSALRLSVVFLQHVFSQLLCERIHELLPVIEERRCEGMVLTGGCALVGHTITQLIYGIPNQVIHSFTYLGFSRPFDYNLTFTERWTSVWWIVFEMRCCFRMSMPTSLWWRVLVSPFMFRLRPMTVASLLGPLGLSVRKYEGSSSFEMFENGSI